jgi:Zn-dependent M28 family amino/carboxypeptidase
MLRAQALVILAAAALQAADFSGASALEFTRRAVAFGPRPPGSPAILRLQAYILEQLKTCKCQVMEDDFTAQTPIGAIRMKNIIARFPGKSGSAIAISGHYDTKLFPGRKFVGASDGGSSTGFLLELARALAARPRADDVYLAWFDGEESIREEWRDPDNRYGSRHLAERWEKDGTLRRIKALINVDMIGDKRLNLKRETAGDARLNRLVWQTAAELGFAAYFVNDSISTEDDHIPFVQRGVPAIDLIDFDYPPWHTDEDTLDKISAQSLETVGLVVMEVIRRLERQ